MNKIHQTTFGAGKPLALMHGWAMHSGIWQPFAQQLAQHYRVTCIDLPGHGASANISPFTLEHLSDEVLNALTDERSHWLGWSLGATVVLDIAQRYPERVDALILLAGNPCFIQQTDWPGMKATLLEQFAGQLTDNCTATLLRFLMLQVQGVVDIKSLCQQLKTLTSSYATPDTETLLGGLAILKQTDLRSALAALDKPVLALLGGKDVLVPVTVGQAMQQLQPRLQLHCLDKAAHAPFLSHGFETVAAICHFLDRL